jgi:CubicO group peptidase (beta-lactamase class C family)
MVFCQSISKVLFFTFFISFSNLIGAYAQDNYIDSLNAELSQVFKNSNITGCAVSIVNKNGLVYQKEFGFANIKENKPFGIQTKHTIASVSKTFISVALMKAIQLGYFNLETDINKILPFKVRNPHFPKDIIRIKDLVTHTSGIVDNDSIFSKTYQFLISAETDSSSISLIKEAGLTGGLKDTTLRRFMFSYLNSNGRLFSTNNFNKNKVGKSYNYSNIASALAAYLIEIKSGVSFASFTDKHIFKPLKMTHSEWKVNTKDLENRAIPYYTADIAFPFYNSLTYPDGGLTTTLSELSRFVQEMINSLNGTSKLLAPKSVSTMFKPMFSDANVPDNMT